MFLEPRAPSRQLAEELRRGVDAACATAARAVAEADVLLLCAGAGWSADSGLATYSSVANVEAYKQRGLEYCDLSQPRWLEDEPELFWGFWGQCFNDYRSTAPHAGYEILDRWVERRFRHSALAEDIRQELRLMEPTGYDWEASFEARGEPYEVEGHAGAFFAITSNVDAHLLDWFRACEVREVHGNVELYQCAKRLSNSCPGVWRAPRDFRFQVNRSTMLAPRGPPSSQAEALEEIDETLSAPHIGCVRAGGRPTMLRYMPEARRSDIKQDASQSGMARDGFETNHPSCRFCGGRARPAVLMFEDVDWQDLKTQLERKNRWVHAVLNLIALQEVGRHLKVVILEVGAGANVTTIRNSAEQILRGCLAAGAKAQLVRINPEFPFGDEDDFAPGGVLESNVTSIMSKGLEALQRMDAHMADVIASS